MSIAGNLSNEPGWDCCELKLSVQSRAPHITNTNDLCVCVNRAPTKRANSSRRESRICNLRLPSVVWIHSVGPTGTETIISSTTEKKAQVKRHCPLSFSNIKFFHFVYCHRGIFGKEERVVN